VSQVFHRAATATIALLLCAHICAAQDQSQGQSAWSNFSDKVKNGFSSVTGSLTPKPHDTPADDPTALSSKSKVGPELHVAMARLCEVRKMPGEAVEHYQQALVEDPKYLPALIGFARLRVHTGELEEATRLYETAAKAFPKEASVFNDLGLCYAQRGMFEKATAAIDEAIRLQPTLVLYRNNIAMVLVDLGRIELAYSHLAAVHPEAVAHYNLGYFLFKKGQSGEAVRQFAIAAQRDPSLVQAQQWLQRLQSSPAAVVAAAPWQPAPPQPTPNTVEQPGREPDYHTAARPPMYGSLPSQTPNWGPPESSHAVVGPLDPDTERHKILRLPDVAAESADPPLPPEGSGGR
jgi:Flp pilus assembly protein TadD